MFKLALAAGALALAGILAGPVAVAVGLTIAALSWGIVSQATRTPRQPWMPLLAMVPLLVATPAFAQDGIDVGSVFGAWRPYIVEIVGILAAAFVGLILEMVRRWTGLSIEGERREAIQTAVSNAAGLLLAKAEGKLDGKSVNMGNPAVNEAVSYVLKGAPQAVAYFGLTPERIAQMIAAKLPQVEHHA